MKKTRILYFLCVVLAHLTLSGCIKEDEVAGQNLKVGDALPEFSVVLTDGTEVTNRALRGQRALIVFFRTACGDCRKELPVIEKFYRTYAQANGVVVLAIGREESAEVVVSYWQKEKLTIPVSPQHDRHIYSLFATQGTPRIYVVDDAGTISATFDDKNMPTLEMLVQAFALP